MSLIVIYYKLQTIYPFIIVFNCWIIFQAQNIINLRIKMSQLGVTNNQSMALVEYTGGLPSPTITGINQ